VLRPGFKCTVLGPVPKDWSAEAIGAIGTVIRGASPRPKGDKRYYGGNIPRLMVEDVTRDKKWVTPGIDFLTKDGAALSRPCKRGTLTLVCSGTPTVVGLPSLLAVDACIHDGMLALIQLQKSVSANFLFYALTGMQERLHAAATHGGTFVNLTTFGLRTFKIALPPTKSEQEAIAEVLSDADALIESLEQLIAKKALIKQGTMQELLTGKRRLAGFGSAKLQRKKTDAGEIPEDWGVHSLRDEIEHLDAGVSVKSAEGKAGVDVDNIYILKTSAVVNGIFNPNECKKVARDDVSRVKLPARADCIVISRMNTPDLVGECGYVDKDYPHLFLPDRLWMTRFTTRSEICPRWLSYLLSSAVYKRKLKEAATGTSGSMKNISQDALLSLRIPWPESKEQLAIANIISDMDAELAAIEAELAKARQLKQGMMQELLTGKVRLV
jgi:type I restriction enzyme, S subunit